MKQPGILVRSAGSPLVAALLIASAALVIFGWFQGQVEWWVALAALGCAFRTFSAVVKLRRYKAWKAEWEAMGRGGASLPVAKERSRMTLLLVVAAMIIIPVIGPSPGNHDYAEIITALRWVWLLLAFYCLFRFFRALGRRTQTMLRSKREARIDKSLDDPITVAVSHGSDCPTRASVQRNLPNYCLQLLARE